MSAATAVRCADLGYRTVVLSTDPAHSLGDSFTAASATNSLPWGNNRGARRSTCFTRWTYYWGRVQDYLNVLSLPGAAWTASWAEEISVLPGMEELASLMQITHLAESGDYDVIVIDAAPTGSTLQLVGLPEWVRWYIEKVFPFQRKTIQLARPFMKRASFMVTCPCPKTTLLKASKTWSTCLNAPANYSATARSAAVRLVLNPEKMVVAKHSAHTYLNLYGYAVDAVVCNRGFPRSTWPTNTSSRKQSQQENLQFVEEAPAAHLQDPRSGRW
ncbi:MAG: ArsA family ATPase [Caldilineaceae bacterium]